MFILEYGQLHVPVDEVLTQIMDRNGRDGRLLVEKYNRNDVPRHHQSCRLDPIQAPGRPVKESRPDSCTCG